MSLDDVKLHLVDSFSEAENMMRWLGERHEFNVLGVDTETTGFNPYARGAAIRLVQIGDTQHGWAIPWEDWRGLFLDAMSKWDGLVAIHNVAFENKWFRTHSPYKPPRETTVDTMLAAHVIDPLGSGALKRLSSKYVDPRAAGGETILQEAFSKHGWGWDTVPINFKPYWMYGALDPVLTARIWGAFRNQVWGLGPYREVFEMEMAVRHIISDMEANGARIDYDYCREKGEALHNYADQLLAWGKDNYGVVLGSNPQVANQLEKLGAEIFETTPTGQPKVDKALLAYWTNPENGGSKELQVFADTTRKMRRARKYASTYFEAFTKLVDDSIDGLIHTDIRTLGARTGRMSSANPNLQNVPRDSALVRNAFIASDARKLVTVDFSQIEMRMLGHFSDDPALQAAFIDADRTGGDFFVEIGKQVYADPDFQKKDTRRNLIKSTMYGMAYGAGPMTMAKTAGIPVARMSMVVDGVKGTYPGIDSFMKKVESTGFVRERDEGQGYVTTPMGRRLPCDRRKAYTLVNYLIQSTAGDALKKAIIRLDAAGWTPYALYPVHDEVVFDVPDEHVDAALHDIPRIMGDRKSFAVPLPAEAEGPFSKWGEKYL